MLHVHLFLRSYVDVVDPRGGFHRMILSKQMYSSRGAGYLKSLKSAVLPSKILPLI